MSLRILSVVHEESVRIAQYYEQRQAGLGVRFFDSLEKAFEDIAANPAGFPRLESISTERTIRRVILNRVPYMVVYEIVASECLVFAVRHVSQEPPHDLAED